MTVDFPLWKDRRLQGTLLLTIPFLTAVVFAWGWFRIGSSVRASSEALQLRIKREIPAHTFLPDSTTVDREILGTTNFLNGSFRSGSGGEYRVFAATWIANDRQGLVVAEHTPDVCWARTGWISFNAGQPRVVNIDLEGRPLVFECRAFRSPDSIHQELVIWATFVGGFLLPQDDLQAVGSVSKQEDPSLDRDRFLREGRQLSASHFFRAVSQRLPARGLKQFVRISVQMGGDWRQALEMIRGFAPQWLTTESLGDLSLQHHDRNTQF